MYRRIAAPWICILFLLCFVVIIVEIAPPTEATTIYVDDSGGADYNTIQEAINAASEGDTVYIYSGIYNENVIVDKTINLTGEDNTSTIIDGGGSGDVLRVTADGVDISGFKITGSGFSGDGAGVKLAYVSNCEITNNNLISNGKNGIRLEHSNDNIIKYNDLSYNNYAGIIMSSSNRNSIMYNQISNHRYGISVGSSSENTIIGNIMVENSITINANNIGQWNTHAIDTSNMVNGKPIYYWKNKDGGTVSSGAGQVILANCSNVTVDNQKLTNGSVGIYLGFSSNINVINNNISNNQYGMWILYSSQNFIKYNAAFSNEWEGIHLTSSSENIIVNNNLISNKRHGMELTESSENLIISNIASNNNDAGINLRESNDNTIEKNDIYSNNYSVKIQFTHSFQRSFNNRIFHNNFRDNAYEAIDNDDMNFWDNGYPSGGNYWGNYSGSDSYSGINQDNYGSDGIGDTPYIIDDDTEDKYPFMKMINTDLPNVKLITPENNSLLKDFTIICFLVSDFDLKSVYYSINEEPFRTFKPPYEFDTADWDDGSYVVTIKAEDYGNNICEMWYNFKVDVTPPSIISSSLYNKSSNVDLDLKIIIDFSEQMDTGSVEDALSISPYAEYICSWSNNNMTFTIEFSESLEYNTNYQVKIGTSARDLAGHYLKNPYEDGFITEAKPRNQELTIIIFLVFIVLVIIVILLGYLFKRKSIKSIEVKPLQELQSTEQGIPITCPDCGYIFNITEGSGLTHVQCPNCGTQGTFK